MLFFPNAKVNIGLFVTEKRADNYHNLLSIFYPIPLFDVLEIMPNFKNQEDIFEFSGLKIDGNPKDNLVTKAVRIFREYYSIPPIYVHLNKNIPLGAGLGGGSSDAAFCLSGLNELFSLGVSKEVLLNMCRQMGSDCSFFIENRPLLAMEKGDVFREIDFPSLHKYTLCLLFPNIHISTNQAYQGITPTQTKVCPKEVLNLPLEDWKEYLNNDFEKSIFIQYPELRVLKEALYENGAIFAAMSGSGSTIYGLFPKETVIPECKLTALCKNYKIISLH